MRIVAMLAGLAAVVLSAAAPAAPPERLLALATEPPASIGWVDALTLKPLPGPTFTLPAHAAGGTTGPTRSTYVLGSDDEPKLTFLDLETMRPDAPLAVGTVGPAFPIAWPQEDRLFVETWTCCPAAHLVIAVVDPVRHVVVGRVPLGGGGVVFGRSAAGLVALVEASKRIKPVRLATIGREGDVRSVRLGRIAAGTAWRGRGSNRRAAIRQPGLAVDRAGGVAYVVDPSGLVAQVDLQTLTVSYHSPPRRQLARATKQLEGPMRYAAWAGDGRIVVSGTDAKPQRTGGASPETWTPAGVAVIDTRTWAARMLDSEATSFTTAPGSILVSGNGVFSAYGLDGTPRFRAEIPAGNAYATVFGDYAYVSTEGRITIVDTRSGAVVSAAAASSLYLIPES